MISWKGLALPSTAPIVISTAAAAKSEPTRLYVCVRGRKREIMKGMNNAISQLVA